MNKELIFISEKGKRNKKKPDFYDALFLSMLASQHAHYQSIPLRTNVIVSFHLSETNMKFTIHQHSLQIEREKHMTEEDALDTFKSFAIKDGKKVTYLAHGISNPKKKRNIGVLVESVSKSFDEV